MSVPILGNSIPIIGEERTGTDPRDALIAELMGVIGINGDIFRAIVQDVEEAKARLDLPPHALQIRLLAKIGEVAEKAVTEDPMAGALGKIESGMVTRYLNWLKHTTKQLMSAEECEVVERAIKNSLFFDPQTGTVNEQSNAATPTER